MLKQPCKTFFSCVNPFIQIYIFCNKQLTTVWIKIYVNCNFNDNRVIYYIKTQLKYPNSLKPILRRFLISIKMFFLESPHLMGFFEGSQMLQQNCEHNKLYIFKIRRLIISRISWYRKILKRQQSSPFYTDIMSFFQPLRISCSACLRSTL